MDDLTIIITIVVSGTNIMSEPLCKVDGIVYRKGKKIKNISYEGPVSSAEDVLPMLFKIYSGTTNDH